MTSRRDAETRRKRSWLSLCLCLATAMAYAMTSVSVVCLTGCHLHGHLRVGEKVYHTELADPLMPDVEDTAEGGGATLGPGHQTAELESKLWDSLKGSAGPKR